MNTLFGGLFIGGTLSTILMNIKDICWIIPIFILKLFGYGYFVIKNDPVKITEIIKLLEETTTSTVTMYECGKIKPMGIFIGWKYCGMYIDSINNKEQQRELQLYTTHKIFKTLVENDHKNFQNTILLQSIVIDTFNQTSNILIYERMGNFYNSYYEKRRFNMTKYNPKLQQKSILESIIRLYKKEKRTSVFISGESGTGKSMIGFLLAKELNAKLCRTFNPTDPGDTMIKLVRDLEPTSEKPVIIVLDEANILIRKITDGVIRHKDIPILVHDKITFNRFMDDMMFYENVILILTSNEPKKSMDDIDESYLRKGRIDEYFVL